MDTIGAASTRDLYQVDGSGLSAAIIDTGTDYNHPALGGDGYGPGHKVVDGWDFSKDKPDPYPLQSHGTMTAGLVASNAPGAPGVAPGANIVALRVFGDDNSGSYDYVAEALQYAIDHAEADKISVVNISLSDGGNYSRDSFSRDHAIGQRIAALVHTLAEMRIPVVTAAGNSFDGTPGMGFTAILTETISVTASDGDDHLLANAQRLGPADGFDAATDLAAPGIDIVAPTGGDGYSQVEGTSFSAPLVSGAIILLQQIYQKRFGLLPTVDDLEGWLKQGATTIHDSVTGTDIGRLDIARSASLIPRPTPIPDPQPTPNPSPVVAPQPIPDPVPQTKVSLDGLPLAVVPSDSPANPLVDFGQDTNLPTFEETAPPAQGEDPTTGTQPAEGLTAPDIGSQFTSVEFWNAPSTVITGAPATTSVATASDSIRAGTIRVFHVKALKKGRKLPRPSRFARGVHRR